MEKDLASRLKEWVKANGPVTVGNMVYGPNQVVSYELDPKLVTMALLAARLSREEVWPLLSINKTNLGKGLRKLSRNDLLDVAISTGKANLSEKIAFQKIKG